MLLTYCLIYVFRPLIKAVTALAPSERGSPRRQRRLDFAPPKGGWRNPRRGCSAAAIGVIVDVHVHSKYLSSRSRIVRNVVELRGSAAGRLRAVANRGRARLKSTDPAVRGGAGLRDRTGWSTREIVVEWRTHRTRRTVRFLLLSTTTSIRPCGRASRTGGGTAWSVIKSGPSKRAAS